MRALAILVLLGATAYAEPARDFCEKKIYRGPSLDLDVKDADITTCTACSPTSAASMS